jgi:hypothetical protein
MANPLWVIYLLTKNQIQDLGNKKVLSSVDSPFLNKLAAFRVSYCCTLEGRPHCVVNACYLG